MRTEARITCAVLAIIFGAAFMSAANAQECLSCRTVQFRPAVRTVQTVVRAPVCVTWELSEEVIERAETRRERRQRVRGVNWPCVGAALLAYRNCAMSKQGDRRGLRGFFGRLFRRNR